MIGCFGKIPASADFVSLHGALPEVAEFDLWLQRTLVDLDQSVQWQSRFDELPLCYFSFVSTTGAWLLGGVVSSHDSSGRRYPFFIFQLVRPSDSGLNAHTLSEVFAAQIKPLLIDASQGLDTASVFQQLKALRPWDLADVALYRRVHVKFLDDFELRDVANALQPSYVNLDGVSLPARLMGLRESVCKARPPVMHFPLPAARGLMRPVADFWCEWLSVQSNEQVPAVSVLVDDFMHPGLLCFASRQVATAYRVLTGEVSCPSLLHAEPGISLPAMRAEQSLRELVAFCSTRQQGTIA